MTYLFITTAKINISSSDLKERKRLMILKVTFFLAHVLQMVKELFLFKNHTICII